MIVNDWLVTRIGPIAAWLAALILCSVAGLAWFGYRATDEWHRSSALLVERRTREIADVLALALARDMRAVQASILEGREWDEASLASPYEINDLVAGAFARYPYPECFFAWRRSGPAMVFFARTERMPNWLAPGGREDRYPVEVLTNDVAAQILLARVERDVLARREYSVFEINLGGNPYQVIARPLYRNLARERPDGAFGFLVNLTWVRRHYFSSITEQVMRIAQARGTVTTAIVDERGTAIVGEPGAPGVQPVATRQFPLFFFDPMIAAVDPPDLLVKRVWSVSVSGADDPILALAARGARRSLLVVAAGAILLGLGLFVTVRAAKAAADLVTLRADFVSTVTHDLKTPVSVICGIGDTLVRGRVSTPAKLHEYAELLVQEGHRLSRLIDNLLAYARVTDVLDVYSFEPHRPHDLVDDAMKGFDRLLTEAGFRVDIDVPPTLPLVWADRTAIVLALDNLIDNAYRYSGTARVITACARVSSRHVEFRISDLGRGIPADELLRVQRRYARARSANGQGSGLGLAIASRVAVDHRGALRIESAVDAGTTAILTIPIARV